MRSSSGWHRRRTTPADATRRREYNSTEYKQAKRHGQTQIDDGNGYCWRCGRHIPPGTPPNGWHLGHDDNDRRIIRGPECIPCNLGTAARKGAATVNGTPPTTPQPLGPLGW